LKTSGFVAEVAVNEARLVQDVPELMLYDKVADEPS
jgi:hypothetical protein